MSRGAVNNEPTREEMRQVLRSEPDGDRLERAFKMQAEFADLLEASGRQRKVRIDFKALYEGCPNERRKLDEAVSQFADCLIMESAELKDWTAWKHWSSQMGNKQKDVAHGSPEWVREMRIECADLFCFLINACQALGMTATDLFGHYLAKLETNYERQKLGKEKY